MRKFLLLMGLFVALHASATVAPIPSKAQLFKGSTKFYGGIFLGPNVSNLAFSGKFFISQSYLVTSKYQLFHHVGISGIYQFNELFRLQLDLVNETKGLGYEDILYYPAGGQQLQTVINNQLRLNYYTVPLTAQLHFGRTLLWYVEAGPYYSMIHSATETGNMLIQRPNPIIAAGGFVTKSQSFEINKDGFYKDDAGAVIGAGLIVPLSYSAWGPTYSIYINARYSRGFVNLYKGETVAELNPVEEIIGYEPDIIDPRYFENDVKTSAFTLRFGLVIAF